MLSDCIVFLGEVIHEIAFSHAAFFGHVNCFCAWWKNRQNRLPHRQEHWHTALPLRPSMKPSKNLISGSLLIFCLGASAQSSWTHSARIDDFDGTKEVTTRVQNGSASIALVERSNGGKLVIISGAGRRFDCYLGCSVRVKFDDQSPVTFDAKSSKISMPVFAIREFEKFEALAVGARKITIRAPMFEYAEDLVFETTEPFRGMEPARTAAEASLARKAKDVQCQKNAMNEDYTACMSR